MAQRLKTNATYTTTFGSTKTGPAMCAVIIAANFDVINRVAKITKGLYEDEASYLAGNQPFAKVTKTCTEPDFTTYFGSDPEVLNTYWNSETTLVDAQSYIRDDWETIV